MATNHLNIGIVGGSIAGCSAAHILSGAGHIVTVYERSSEALTGRGAGIGTTPAMIESLIQRGMIDTDFPYRQLHNMPFIGRTTPDERLGHTAWVMPINLALLNWGDLYTNLRRRVPDAVYHAGRTVTDARMNDDKTITITLDDGSEAHYDLLIFADGYRSFGRSLLFPDVTVNYRGYVLWRGVLDEKYLQNSEPLEADIPRLSYKGLPGHLVIYFVPGENGSLEPGKRRVNWAAYVPVETKDLSHFLVDKYGRQHVMSMPPGFMRPDEELRLKGLLLNHLPPYYGEIITASGNTFAQPIYNVDLPAYSKDRMCLFGDAGSMAQPFTGSGVFKGVSNAIDLAEALDTYDSVEAALSAWSDAQTAIAKRLVVLGDQMEQAWIWDAVDFSQMDETTTSEWWNKTVQFPTEFSYGENA